MSPSSTCISIVVTSSKIAITSGDAMLRLTVTGLDAARARIAAIRGALRLAMIDAMTAIGDEAVAAFQIAAPVGQNGDPNAQPAEGDAPGPLHESFVSTLEMDGLTGTLTISTTQPQKLSWVVNGRGPVYPVNKKALFWPGLDHPVRFAKATDPNDFVSPVVEQMTSTAQETFQTMIQQAVNEG